MSQLPIMTPFELTLENELGVEAERFNNDWLFKWYGMTYEGGQTTVDDFRGGRIQYSGIKFGFQQREVFWSAIDRYLDRKVHDTFKQWDVETRQLPSEVRIKSIDGVERTLRRFVARIVALSKETDRRLRGEGNERQASTDDSIANVYTMAEISNLATSHRMLLQHAIEKTGPPAKPNVPTWKWLETFYAENKGLIWLLGILVTGATFLVGYFLH